MGGPALFSGATYQARVAAHIYCHILARRPLGWTRLDDVPSAVSLEVGGVGDDLAVEFVDRSPSYDVQAKHGLKGTKDLLVLGNGLAAKPNAKLVVVVDSSASQTNRIQLREDLERLRSGRTTPLRKTAKTLIKGTTGGKATLSRMWVVQIDVDATSHDGTTTAKALLFNALANPAQIDAAWSVLVDLASESCARRLRGDRDYIAAALEGAGIKVKTLTIADAFHQRLHRTKFRIDQLNLRGVLSELEDIEAEIGLGACDASVRFRLAIQKSAVLREAGRFSEARLEAQKALDIDSSDAKALGAAALSAAADGDLAAAEQYASELRSNYPNDELAWMVSARVALDRDEAVPEAPAGVAGSYAYRGLLAEIALVRGDLSEAGDRIEALIREGQSSPRILLARTKVLLMKAAAGEATPPQRWKDAIGWLDQVEAGSPRPEHPHCIEALRLRVEVFHQLGEVGHAEQVAALLRSRDPDDPETLRQLALRELRSHRPQAAVDVLLATVTQTDATLLALRAAAYAELGRDTEAKRDLDSAESLLPSLRDADLIRGYLAEAALVLREWGRARSILEGVSERGKKLGVVLVVRARLAWEAGDLQDAEALYCQAADEHPQNSASVYSELAHRLLRAERFVDAIAYFDKVDDTEVAREDAPSLAKALLEAKEYPRAKALVEAYSEGDEPPIWVLGVGIELAALQGDAEVLVDLLAKIVAQGDERHSTRLHLAGALLQLNRPEEARKQVDAVLGAGSVEPLARAQAAVFLSRLNEEERAIAEAFEAYREAPNDPKVNRVLVGTVMMAKGSPRVVERVEPGCHYVLVDDKGQREAFDLYLSPPVDPQKGEQLVAGAEAMGTLGKQVGDKVRRGLGPLAKEWTVESISPVEVHAANDAAHKFASRFHDEPFFVAAFDVGDLSRPSDLAPFIGSLHARVESSERVVEAYQELGLPLGMMARALQVPVPAVMERLGTSADGPKLAVDFSEPGLQEESQGRLVSTRRIVVTRSALHTLRKLGMAASVADFCEILAPRALAAELEEELREAREWYENGTSKMELVEGALRVVELEAGHPALRDLVQVVEEQKQFVDESVEIHARPLEMLAHQTSEDEAIREHIGAASYDAVELAKHTKAVLYADDLGLRRLQMSWGRATSTSSLGVLGALRETQGITPEEHARGLMRLLEERYATVVPQHGWMTDVLGGWSGLTFRQRSAALGTFANPTVPLQQMAEIFIEVVREMALRSVATVSVADLTELVLVEMATVWGAQAAASAVQRAATNRLGLLVMVQADVARAVVAFRERTQQDA